jgi:hypothetical protein
LLRRFKLGRFYLAGINATTTSPTLSTTVRLDKVATISDPCCGASTSTFARPTPKNSSHPTFGYSGKTGGILIDKFYVALREQVGSVIIDHLPPAKSHLGNSIYLLQDFSDLFRRRSGDMSPFVTYTIDGKLQAKSLEDALFFCHVSFLLSYFSTWNCEAAKTSLPSSRSEDKYAGTICLVQDTVNI